MKRRHCSGQIRQSQNRHADHRHHSSLAPLSSFGRKRASDWKFSALHRPCAHDIFRLNYFYKFYGIWRKTIGLHDERTKHRKYIFQGHALESFILILAIIVNVVLASRLLWGPQSLVSYRELASQYAELLKERDGFDVVNAGLSREIRLLQSDEKYVEKMIRQRLNFVRSNEILYLFTEDANARGALPHDGKN